MTDIEKCFAPPKTIRYRITKKLREMDRKAGKYDRTRRLREVIGENHGRNDWGHRLMALVGKDFCGNWDVPHAPDVYIRHSWARNEDGSVVPGTQNDVIVTTHAMTAWDGVKRGEEWRTFDWQDDGLTLRVGWLGDDGRIHDSGIGAYSGELKMFRKWFIWDSWIKSDWFGLRRWLYYKGLHAAVHQKKPFACQAMPARNSGGYDHWYCQYPIGFVGMLRRRLNLPVKHSGPHLYHNMRWNDAGQVRHINEEQLAQESKNI